MPRLKFNHSKKGSELAESYFLAADLFLFFASPAALLILDAVRKKEMTPPAISKKLGITSKTVLDKLKAMEREGILVSYMRSQNTLYRIAHSNIAKAFEQILEFPERKLKETAHSIKPVHPQGQRVAGSLKSIL